MTAMVSTLSKALNAYRPDLADSRLKDQVQAGRYVKGKTARVSVPVADLKARPADDAGLHTQFLLGEEVLVFERKGGWAWVQGARDRYVGYMRTACLSSQAAAPTHRITAPRTFLYPGPDMKFPVSGALSMGGLVTVTGTAETRGTSYLELDTGQFLIAGHAAPVGEQADDFVAVAETLLHTPYLWGGTSAFGIDCSGMVQLCLRMCGVDVLRDTGMQEKTIGTEISRDRLKRGDLVFWKGHVGIMRDAKTLIHANGASMMVSLEPLDEAITRIARLYGDPTSCRRP